MKKAILLAIGIHFFSWLASAQMTVGTSASSRVFPPCTDAFGREVKYFKVPVPDEGPAYAKVSHGIPMIVYNLDMMTRYATSEDTGNFIFFHECGHHVLPHLGRGLDKSGQPQRELEADCYGAVQAKKYGLNLGKILKDMTMLEGGPEHPPGTVRAKTIEYCYNKPDPFAKR